jgi:hypothetical protein
MELGTLFLVLALPCAIAGVVLMMVMVGALHDRGHEINWVFLRLFMPKYIAQYRGITARESGRPAPPFYAFVVLMNLALVLVILGLWLRSG